MGWMDGLYVWHACGLKGKVVVDQVHTIGFMGSESIIITYVPVGHPAQTTFLSSHHIL